MTITTQSRSSHRDFSVSRPVVKGQVWDPPAMTKIEGKADSVRTLTSANRTFNRQMGADKTDVKPRNWGHNHQIHRSTLLNFILGGVFGLSLVGGFLFLDSADDFHSNSYNPQSVSHVDAVH